MTGTSPILGLVFLAPHRGRRARQQRCPTATGRCRQAVGISGRAGALAGRASPEPSWREQVAREVRSVIAEDTDDSAYRALIRLTRIRTSGENRLDSRDPAQLADPVVRAATNATGNEGYGRQGTPSDHRPRNRRCPAHQAEHDLARMMAREGFNAA
jgi:hypothetical protein